jgi:hypothetical protein
MTDNQMKLLAALVLFGTWVGLVAFKVQGADDLVSCIKDGLIGLGLYHIGDAAGQRRAAPQFPGSGQS